MISEKIRIPRTFNINIYSRIMLGLRLSTILLSYSEYFTCFGEYFFFAYETLPLSKGCFNIQNKVSVLIFNAVDH